MVARTDYSCLSQPERTVLDCILPWLIFQRAALNRITDVCIAFPFSTFARNRCRVGVICLGVASREGQARAMASIERAGITKLSVITAK
jgi:hypothetical protein